MDKLPGGEDQKAKPMLLIYDEYASFSPFRFDSLKERIRSIEGIPSTSYKVFGKDRVFVFEKLVSLVVDLQDHQQPIPSDEQIFDLLSQAIITPYEAVAIESIKPEGYSIEKAGDDVWQIHFEPFDAVLLASFASKDAAFRALSRILVSDPVDTVGQGDFVFNGMAFTTKAPWSVDSLPVKPALQARQLDDCRSPYRSLARTVFHDGFALIAEPQLEALKAEELAWVSLSEQEKTWVRRQAPDLWGMVQALGLESLNDINIHLSEYELDDLRELRAFYPELVMLSDGSLHDWFGAFQSECCFRRSWPAYRDDDFLMYLLGKQIDAKLDDKSTDLGLMLGSGLLMGQQYDHAKAKAVQWFSYERALSGLAWRTARAMGYLTDYADISAGQEVSTLGDMMRLGRKYKVDPIMVEQVSPLPPG